MKTAIIIPALNPDMKLISLVRKIRLLSDSAIIVVDDGSDTSCGLIFKELEDKLSCTVVRHPKNLGKGSAIKTGIELAAKKYPDLAGYITADADGQHLPEDIVRVSNTLELHRDSLVLGTRDFSRSGVPLKSRWGNRITSFVFYLSNCIHCPDTQTGLRGIPTGLTQLCLSVPGERFEYEMNMLTTAAKKGIELIMVPIETLYTENNKSSHFHPVLDSIRIYSGIIRFGIASLSSAATDILLFSLLTIILFDRTPAGILASTVIARCISGIFNFTLNKLWSFGSRGNTVKQAYRYAALFLIQMLLSWGIVTLLSYIQVNLTLLKILTDSALFLISYFIQKTLVFGHIKLNEK